MSKPRDVIHWANDKSGRTACGESYSLSTERTRRMESVTCERCRDKIKLAMESMMDLVREEP